MSGKPIALVLLGAALLATPACKKRVESAKEELKERGYDLTPEAYFRAAESDDVAIMAKLVESGIAADTRNSAGDTALHAAAAAGMKKSADFLLDHKVPVDVTGADGRTPLMAAVLTGSRPMVRYLLSQKADPLKKDAKGYKPLMLAVSEGRAEMVAELAPYDRENLDAALLVAALEGRAGVIDALTSYGASVYARMDDGRTPLMLAAEHGNVEAVEMLLEIGANRFSMDDQGKIAADMAREAGHEELALRLAEQPKGEEFGIEEPADLGAEMLAQMAAADSAVGMADGDGGTPAGAADPDPARPEVSGSPQSSAAFHGPPRGKAPALAGVILKSAPKVPAAAPAGESSAPPPPAGPLVMRAYRQKELPLRVESVQGEVATLRLAGGAVEEVSQGAVIPGSRLKVLRVQRRMQQIKDSSGGPVEVSVVDLEDPATGRSRELVSGLAATAHDPVALVQDAGGGYYIARAGQRFRSAEGEEFSVIDVRPNQMVIENRTKGDVITVPLRGPRG